jgi:hypothetical protein
VTHLHYFALCLQCATAAVGPLMDRVLIVWSSCAGGYIVLVDSQSYGPDDTGGNFAMIKLK